MEQIENSKKRLNVAAIPMFVALVLAAVMIVSVFLPYATATERHAERLEEYSDYYSVDELDMTGKDMINMSMAEFARMYGTMSEEMFGSSWGIFYVTIVILIAGFCICTLIFAALKKPIGVIIFNVLATLVFMLQNFDYKDRGIIPGDNYNWGIAYYAFAVCSAIIIVCAIAAIVLKIIEKKKAYEG